MELRFVAPQLRQLDGVGSEVLACCVFSDERPLRGLAGLIDWRMAGRLSQWVEAGELRGERGEVVLIPGKPRIAFEKLILLGLGPRDAFDERACRGSVETILNILSGLRVRMAVVERPGRHLDDLDALRAVDAVLDACEGHQDQDILTLVEPPHEQKRIAQHLAEERRRRRLR
ncbi:MAG: leucyl aminopeptidase [Polyangiaceae bacterium]|nr:leucyl aminopeptidase [Polyangiaceae bacterium]